MLLSLLPVCHLAVMRCSERKYAPKNLSRVVGIVLLVCAMFVASSLTFADAEGRFRR